MTAPGARIAPDWLARAETRAVMAALAEAAPLFVGGCVRDALLGRESADVDICVAVPPQATSELLEAAGLRAIPTGFDHGTVTALSGARSFEVTSLRRDVATDGRRAVVAFTDDVAVDAARRDFTMNALYANAEGAVLDPLGGLADLRARRVRFIGDPGARIAEDRLRVLRFFRFHAVVGDPAPGLDTAGLAACAAAAGTLDALSRERVGAEMRRLLGAPDPAPALEAMAETGVLAAVAPGARAAEMAALIPTERALALAPDWLRRLAALGPPGDAQTRLRLSRAEAARLSRIAEARRRSDLTPAALGAAFGAETARDALALEAASARRPVEADILKRAAEGAERVFPLAAADLLAQGLAEGPALGEALARGRAAWLASDLKADRAALLAAALST